MEGIQSLIISFLLVGLFFVSMTSFAVIYNIDNGANQSILMDSKLNSTYSGLNRSLVNAKTTAQASKNATDSEVTEPPAGDFILTSVIQAGKTFFNVITGIYNLTIGFLASKLGLSNTVVTFTIATIFTIVMIIYLWVFIRVGQK